MQLSSFEYIGYLAGFLTTIAFIPQVIKAWFSKSTNDISLLMFIIFATGVSCWLIYGLLTNNYPIIISNLITLGLSLLVLIAKFKYNKNV